MGRLTMVGLGWPGSEVVSTPFAGGKKGIFTVGLVFLGGRPAVVGNAGAAVGTGGAAGGNALERSGPVPGTVPFSGGLGLPIDVSAESEALSPERFETFFANCSFCSFSVMIRMGRLPCRSLKGNVIRKHL
jgi:hypothetical protein